MQNLQDKRRYFRRRQSAVVETNEQSFKQDGLLQNSFWDWVRCLFRPYEARDGFFWFRNNANEKLKIEKAAKQDAYSQMPQLKGVVLQNMEKNIFSVVDRVKNMNYRAIKKFIKAPLINLNQNHAELDNYQRRNNLDKFIRNLKDFSYVDLKNSIIEVADKYNQLCQFRNENKIDKDINAGWQGIIVTGLLFAGLLLFEFFVASRNARSYVQGGLQSVVSSLIVVSLVIPIAGFISGKFFKYWNNQKNPFFLIVAIGSFIIALGFGIYGLHFLNKHSDFQQGETVFSAFGLTLFIWVIAFFIAFAKAFLFGEGHLKHWLTKNNFENSGLISKMFKKRKQKDILKNPKENKNHSIDNNYSFNKLHASLKEFLSELQSYKDELNNYIHDKLQKSDNHITDVKNDTDRIISVWKKYTAVLQKLANEQKDFLNTYYITNEHARADGIKIASRANELLTRKNAFNYSNEIKEVGDELGINQLFQKLKSSRLGNKNNYTFEFQQYADKKIKEFFMIHKQLILEVKDLIEKNINIPKTKIGQFNSPLNNGAEFKKLITILDQELKRIGNKAS